MTQAEKDEKAHQRKIQMLNNLLKKLRAGGSFETRERVAEDFWSAKDTKEELFEELESGARKHIGWKYGLHNWAAAITEWSSSRHVADGTGTLKDQNTPQALDIVKIALECDWSFSPSAFQKIKEAEARIEAALLESASFK